MRLVAVALAQFCAIAAALTQDEDGQGLLQQLSLLVKANAGLALGQPDEEATEPLTDEEDPWWVAVDSFHFPHVAAIDLNQTDMLSQIRGIGSDYVLVEFYAPWCPHCQQFALDYERVAETLQQISGPKTAVAATVDCVMFEAVCAQWEIDSYPSMLWASKADWLAGSPAKLTEVNADLNAEAITKWVSETMHVPLTPVSKDKVAAEFHAALTEARQSSKPSSDFHELAPTDKADTWDMQLAVAMLLRTAMNTLNENPEADKQQVLHSFVQLLRRGFPGEDCRSSLASLSQRLESEEGTPSPDDVEADWQLCGTPWEEYGKRGWRSCRGSVPGKRGFTCGLWTLFHTLAAQSQDVKAGQDLEVVRQTVGNFFGCQKCRDHFMSLPVADKDRQDRTSAQLWWWRAHNAVNERVKGIEEKTDVGDAAFPKIQWPPAELCATCKRHLADVLIERSKLRGTQVKDQSTSQDWDVSEVVSFLDQYYHII